MFGRVETQKAYCCVYIHSNDKEIPEKIQKNVLITVSILWMTANISHKNVASSIQYCNFRADLPFALSFKGVI